MTTTTQYPSLSSLRIAVPITTALFGLLGVGVGLYATLQKGPENADNFGIRLPTRLTTHSEPDCRQRAYIQIVGIRNFATGLSLLSILSYWRFSSACQSSPVAAGTVQKVLAILVGIGPLVQIGDGLILVRYARWNDDLSEEDRNYTKEKAMGHIALAAPVIALAYAWWSA